MRKKIYTYFLCIFILSCCRISYSQSPWSKLWDARFGGRQIDFLNDFLQTADGGFILAGYSLSGLNGDKSQPSRGGNDFWIVKTDGNGIKQWDKRFGGSLNDYLNSIQQTHDGGYILGGTSSSGNNGDKSEPGRGLGDYWMVKLDASGIKLWDKRFGGSNAEFLTRVIQTSDDGYLLTGVSRSDSSGDKTQATKGNYDYWIVRTDSLGNKIWDADIGGIDDEQLKFAGMTSDNGFILGGSSISGIGGDKSQPTQGDYDYWIVKTDSLGTIQWDKDFGGSDIDMLQSMDVTAKSAYILGGMSQSGISGDKTKPLFGAQDYWIIKTDSAGNFLWDQDFGNTGIDDDIGSTFQTRDGGFVICGESQSPAGGDKSENNLGISQAWIVKTDSSGTKEWDKTILTAPENKIYPYAIQTRNGCFAVAHASWSGIAGYKTEENRDTTHATTDYWIITYCDTTLPPQAWLTAPNMLCPGTCTSFNNFSLYATSYQWTFNGATTVASTDENPQNICYNNPGSYDVSLIATNINGSDTILLTNYITVYPYPSPQSIIQNGDTLFALQGAQTYQWFYNGIAISGATDYYYPASQSGDYNVVCTDENGCEVEAAIFNVLAGTLYPNNNLDRWILFPNPVVDFLSIPKNINRESTGISIYNLIGEKIISKQDDGSGFIDCNSLPGGTYMIEFSISNMIIRNIFTKQ
ncbi:MAG: PKD domain-containing protein [Bacteroidetes bacterium]|nr:PKD domain-containing protein [Bacteroidota bacterium]